MGPANGTSYRYRFRPAIGTVQGRALSGPSPATPALIPAAIESQSQGATSLRIGSHGGASIESRPRYRVLLPLRVSRALAGNAATAVCSGDMDRSTRLEPAPPGATRAARLPRLPRRGRPVS